MSNLPSGSASQKGLNRRDFLKAVGVTGAATAVACDPLVPAENVLPYVVQPEQLVPGIATWFATRCGECSASCGVLARNREGRIVKLEGNPDHPGNLGKLCARGQAGLQGTYGPDRFKGPMKAGVALGWDDAVSTVADAVKGGGVAWLGLGRSGATGAVISQFVGAAGGKAVQWEPFAREALRTASKAVFGVDAIPGFMLDDAHTIVSFGADFLGTWGETVTYSRGWANSRDPAHGGFVSRLVCVEPRAGTTSAMSDLHLAAKPGTEAGVALAIASLVAAKNGYAGPAKALLAGVDANAAATLADVPMARLEEIAGWMAAHASVALPGGVHTSAAATELAKATLILNEVAGNVGKSMYFGPTPNVGGLGSYADVVALLEDCKAGKVKTLFLDDLDPVYALPADLGVKDALAKVGTVIAFVNEPTDSLPESALVLPPGTTLESWGDAEAIVGTFTLQQPAMKPLLDTRPVGDVLLAVAGKLGLMVAPAAAAEDAAAADDAAPETEPAEGDVAATPAAVPAPGLDAGDFKTYLAGWWKSQVWGAAGSPGSWDGFWTDALQRGGYFTDVPRTGAAVVLAVAPDTSDAAPAGSDMVLVPFPHPYVYDGRHANKPWAQEVPEPLSSFTWGTWVEIHPETAAKLNLDPQHSVKLKTDKGEVEVGWFGSPSIRKDTVGIVLGNGHEKAGRYTRFGANPMKLLGSSVDAASGALKYVSTRATLARTGNESPLFAYLGSLTREDRNVNFVCSIDDLGKGSGPASIVPEHHVPVDPRLTDAGLNDMYPEPDHPTYRFAMAIDLNRCTGCGACETACFAENNLATVGPEQIKLSRHMGWIRLSRYWEGGGEHPDVRFQPNMCQQCSHAPCEGVCPVLATYHNMDGLNAMVYNRCVGTRYCANNCPYTARRFNFHTFMWPDSFNLMLNPDVSTREMGVMEKCTFCVQRLRDIKDRYRDEGRTAPSSAFEKAPACVQTCPTDAMTFGNAKEHDSAVYKLFQSERAYTFLGELNTKPGVRYLARINHTPSALHHGGGHGDAGGEAAGGHHAGPDASDAGHH